MQIVTTVQNLCSCLSQVRVYNTWIPAFFPQARLGQVLSITNIAINYYMTILIFKPLYQHQQSTPPNTFVR